MSTNRNRSRAVSASSKTLNHGAAIEKAVAPATPPAELATELQRLNSSAATLAMAVHSLIERLGPVLIPENPSKSCSSGAEPTPGTPVGGIIRVETYRLDVLTDAVNDAIGRLGV